MSKYKILGAIAVLGVVAIIAGAWAKIMHKPYADLFLTIGLLAQGICIAALVWLIFIFQSNKAGRPK
jgi:hypothetical protein